MFKVTLFIIISAFIYGINSSVIGIDFGTDWFKVSLIKTGTPLDIVFNSESKRKTPAAVTIREGVRFYGSEAINLETRFPQDTYARLKNLLGKKYDDLEAADYRKVFQNTMVPELKRNTVAFKHEDQAMGGDTLFTVEELVALLLDHARDQAVIFGKEPVSGAVITIPPYFTQIEREALLDAAKIAKLPVLGLMSDETAVALNYAVARSFPVKQSNIFFDMGAGSTVVAVVEFDARNTTSGKAIPIIKVKSIGYDKTLGGSQFDVRLQQFLADEFMKTHGKKVKLPIQQNARAMARLYKEANRLKQVLSANTEALASVEGLYEDIDFKHLTSRKEFESLCADLFERVTDPIKTALVAAEMELKDIDSLVLVGGSVRMPMVQQHLAALAGEDKIAQHVNGDESAVMGAGLQAARLSKLFRVREMQIDDLYMYPVSIVSDSSSQPIELFPANSKLGTTKSWSPKIESNALKFSVVTNENGEAVNLFDVAIDNLDSLRAEIQTKVESEYSRMTGEVEKRAVEPKLKIQVQLDPQLGLVSVKKAVFDCEMPHVSTDYVRLVDANATAGDSTDQNESIGSKIWNFFSKTNATNATDGSANGTAGDFNVSMEALKQKLLNATSTGEPKAKKTAVKKLTFVQQRFPVSLNVESNEFTRVLESEISSAQARMSQMDQEDEQRLYRATVHNNLEASVYRIRDLMDTSSYEAVSTLEERESVVQLCKQVATWLEEEAYGDDIPVESYLERQKQLDESVKQIFYRKEELEKRPVAVEKLKASLLDAQEYLSVLRNKTGNEQYHTTDELKELETLLEETNSWLSEKLGYQEGLDLFQNPAIHSSDVSVRRKALESLLQVLQKKPKPVPKSKTTTSMTRTESETSESTGTVNPEEEL